MTFCTDRQLTAGRAPVCDDCGELPVTARVRTHHFPINVGVIHMIISRKDQSLVIAICL